MSGVLRGAPVAILLGPVLGILGVAGRSGPFPAAHAARMPGGWSVVVVGADSADRRRPAAVEAVAHWNGVFADLGLERPFGSPTFVQEPVPEALLAAYARTVAGGAPGPAAPNALSRVPGAVVIALSDSAIVSFTARLGPSGRAVIGIRTDRVVPLSLANVSRNVVAHELGHVLGLGHNGDLATLMCGRPARCRPGAFQSDVPRFFPLMAAERERLRRLHAR